MATRRSLSREPSLLTVDSVSRRSSTGSNPNIFSDDYALDPIDSELNLSLVDSVDTDETLTNSTITPYPAIPNRLSVHNRPSSTTKRSNASLRDAVSERTLSTSSRFSRVRAQSPYRGPTAPSHPYGMYPQITRASSIASQSTFRPTERPFVHTGGPEHPYALYSQNTVEDEDEDIGTQPIPLGFSALGFGSSRGRPNSDVGDIVLSDGHIEQLPPYSRYADNVIAKGNMNEIDDPHVVEMDAITSERSSLMNLTSSSPSDTIVAQEANLPPQAEVEEPRWRQTAHKRVCGGIALWLLILIFVVIILAGMIGGVIGGVVGRREGAEASTQPAATTIWMDAGTPPANSTITTCPIGRYVIPLNRTEEIDYCIPPGGPNVAWACLDMAYIGMNIGRNPDGTPNVQFDDYSVDTTQFLYGPQPPDFNGSTLQLVPRMDADNENLGVAMFFYQEFDKLTILPNYALQPNSKRGIDARDIVTRGQKWENQPLAPGDQPWYCFWNSTISEFWIFLEQNSNGTQISPSQTTDAPTPPPPSTTSASISPTTQSSLYPQGQRYSGLNHYSGNGPWTGFPLPTSHTPEKRSYTSAAPYLPQYPRLVKMVEKRRPTNNTQPYCQQMRVLQDWQIVPQEGGSTIMINELQWSTSPISSKPQKRDTTTQLKSNCVCEWMST